jgi:hypothetical protein
MGGISNVKLVADAEAIVRATALQYETPPKNGPGGTTGVPESRIRFHVVEKIRGPEVAEVVLPGYLVEQDDFNDQKSPYTFVRPGGRAGSCFANSYRSGGQFLLFLRKNKDGEWTVNWYALAPVNEQLHSESDPWLVWVRGEADKKKRIP